MKLLVLAPLPERSAATRFRLTQFFPALRARGIEPTLRCFYDDDGFDVLYRAGNLPRKAWATLQAMRRRLEDVVTSHNADAVLIQREAAIIGPPLVEWAIRSLARTPIIFDFDDAIWVPYASPTYGQLASTLLKSPGKTYFTARSAAHVLAGNEHLATWARQLNPRVTVLPTVVDTEIFRPAPRSNPVPVLGWIGTHSTAPYLQALLPALRRLARERRFVLRVVGGKVDAADLDVDERPWSLDREVADFQGLDVGLYPLVEDAWSLGKSAFKAIEYMACGVPVVASPVGYTTTVVRDGATGYFARSDDEWVAHLGRLLDDEALRRRLGEAGRRDAVEKWSLAVYAPRFVDVVESVLATARRS